MADASVHSILSARILLKHVGKCHSCTVSKLLSLVSAYRDAERQARIAARESEQAAEQWLRKIPDDPGGLLRRKFLYQYRKRGGVDEEYQSW